MAAGGSLSPPALSTLPSSPSALDEARSSLGPLAGILGSLACGLLPYLHCRSASAQCLPSGPRGRPEHGALAGWCPFSERELWSWVCPVGYGAATPTFCLGLSTQGSKPQVTCEMEKKAHRRSQPVHEKARDWTLTQPGLFLLHKFPVILGCQAGPYTYVMSSLSGWPRGTQKL